MALNKTDSNAFKALILVDYHLNIADYRVSYVSEYPTELHNFSTYMYFEA